LPCGKELDSTDFIHAPVVELLHLAMGNIPTLRGVGLVRLGLSEESQRRVSKFPPPANPIITHRTMKVVARPLGVVKAKKMPGLATLA